MYTNKTNLACVCVTWFFISFVIVFVQKEWLKEGVKQGMSAMLANDSYEKKKTVAMEEYGKSEEAQSKCYHY